MCRQVLFWRCAVTISIRLTADEEARLEALARRTGRSKSFYVRTALHEYLDDLEDAFAADVAIDAFEAEGRRSRPLSALKAEMAR
jgi:RHH-type rel operon transcriptional repressor/antitoxin RelB